MILQLIHSRLASPWECGFSHYEQQSGVLVPMVGEAAWVRPEGRKAYFRGTVKNLSYEVPP